MYAMVTNTKTTVCSVNPVDNELIETDTIDDIPAVSPSFVVIAL